MLIRYLSVTNFRGIDHFEAVMNKNLLSIVGQNDVGKSSVLRAICIFLDKEKMLLEDFPNDVPSKKCQIEIHFESTSISDFPNDNRLIKLRRTFEVYDGKISGKQFIYKLQSIPSEDELNDYKILKETAKTLGIEVPTRKPIRYCTN